MNRLRPNIRRFRRDEPYDASSNDDVNAASNDSDAQADAMENEPGSQNQDAVGDLPAAEEATDNTNENEDDDNIAASTNDIDQQQEQQPQLQPQPQQASFWNAEDDAANEERRRETLLGEIERSQRSNFVHFVLLCLVPTSLLLIVVASVVGESTDCEGFPVSCSAEPRSFINAFTSRCICDAVIAEP